MFKAIFPNRSQFLPYCVFGCALLAHGTFASIETSQFKNSFVPVKSPSPKHLSIATLGETAAAGYAMMLYIQAFDSQAGRGIAIKSIDLGVVQSWLETAMTVNPKSGYPLYLASRVYAHVADPVRVRLLLELVFDKFADDPIKRWPWLVHAAYIARHELGDKALAIRYARQLRIKTAGFDVPRWAQDYEIFLLAHDDQIEASKALLMALLESGQIQDQRELNSMQQRLKDLEAQRQAKLVEAATRTTTPKNQTGPFIQSQPDYPLWLKN